ncbi:hypothetical protein DFH07DRAFT_971318 [Mycena maculata]|uniref:Uncharacterized protein n=1 Tax=Mycena maculata TaxID=230809 RepID=A0AAD7HMU8_9AGAR|nr:hypothetical protein DFH07DRAFT_971318 [Mycena maculata]
MYNDLLGQPASPSPLFDEHRMLRFPAPEKYSGVPPELESEVWNRPVNDVAASGARSEQLRHAREEEEFGGDSEQEPDEPLMGEQYSSDAASDYTLKEVFEYSSDEHDERFGGIREEYSDMPVLVEDDWSDSDYDSESEFEYDDNPSDKPTITPDNQGLWAVVDDWSDSVDESGPVEGCSTPVISVHYRSGRPGPAIPEKGFHAMKVY